MTTAPFDTIDCDRAAVLARAEFMIDTLRTKSICKGWSVDANQCEPVFLDYFRSSSDEMPEFALRFFSDHEQSLDWVLTGRISGLITIAASHSPRAAVQS
jgi:hypothetical protein